MSAVAVYKKYIKLKKKRNKIKQTLSDNFFVAHTKANKDIDIKSFDLRRVIFISVLGLYKTWKTCPSHVLYSAIFFLPLKRDWIYNPQQYDQEISDSTHASDAEKSDMDHFVQLLQWKDSQKLVFWMLDTYKCTDGDAKDTLIDPFWYCVSNKLQTLYDPIIGRKYEPLQLDSKWWTENKHITSASILSEFYFKTMKYATIQAILSQSNPKSFRILTAYSKEERTVFTPIHEQTLNSLFADHKQDCTFDNIKTGNDGWCVSDEYNPYDM